MKTILAVMFFSLTLQGFSQTCTEDKSKCPTPAEVHQVKTAKFFSVRTTDTRLHPNKLSWTIFIINHAAAWASTVAAVRNPKSGEDASEYAAMAGVTAMDTFAFLGISPSIGATAPVYAVVHYSRAATK